MFCQEREGIASNGAQALQREPEVRKFLLQMCLREEKAKLEVYRERWMVAAVRRMEKIVEPQRLVVSERMRRNAVMDEGCTPAQNGRLPWEAGRLPAFLHEIGKAAAEPAVVAFEPWLDLGRNDADQATNKNA